MVIMIYVHAIFCTIHIGQKLGGKALKVHLLQLTKGYFSLSHHGLSVILE